MPAKTISQLTQATTINGTDDFAIEQSGVTKRIAASVVRGDIANANISASAAIAHSKLAALNSAQILVGNGSNVPTAVSVTGDVTISNAGVTTLARPYTLATSQASTSGTSIDFTGIPSWVKRITVMFNGVSLSGTSHLLVQLGAGSVQASGYNAGAISVSNTVGSTTAGTTSTTGIPLMMGNSSALFSGIMNLVLVASNAWVANGTIGSSTANSGVNASAGDVTLSGAIDRVRITTVNGTDTFDAGTINIAYEG